MERDRVTVQEAAARLGMTESAVRKRISRGQIESDRDGDRVFVHLDKDTDQSRTEPDSVPDSRDELIQVLREQLEAEREANRENRRIIAGLVQRVPELEASETAPEKPDEEEPPEETEGSSKSSWWRKLIGR